MTSSQRYVCLLIVFRPIYFGGIPSFLATDPLIKARRALIFAVYLED